MKEFKILFFSILIVVVLGVVYVAYQEHEFELVKQRVAKSNTELLDMNIPPKLNETMNSPNWSIKTWIAADKLQIDCQRAHEYMDEGILEKTIGRKGGGTKYSIFDYLSSCKRASLRAYDLVSPYAKKWCHYRTMNPKFDALCNEWEIKGQGYLDKMDTEYREAITRFSKITNGYYKDEVSQL